MPLDLRKPHERYGTSYGTLVWQNGELYDKSGKLLPKNSQKLSESGYRLPVPLRRKLFMYAHEEKMEQELRTRRRELEKDYQQAEEAFRERMSELAAEAMGKEIEQPTVDFFPPPPPPPLIPFLKEEIEAGLINDELDSMAPEEVEEVKAPTRKRRK